MALVDGTETLEELRCKMLLLGMDLWKGTEGYYVVAAGDNNQYFFTRSDNEHKSYFHDYDGKAAALAALDAYFTGVKRNEQH